MKVITIEKFLELGPCYSEKKIRAIAGDKQEWSAIDILKLANVPPTDRLWAVLTEELIDTRTLRLFAVWCARQFNQTDPMCIEAIDTAERYANGVATKDNLDHARYMIMDTIVAPSEMGATGTFAEATAVATASVMGIARHAVLLATGYVTVHYNRTLAGDFLEGGYAGATLIKQLLALLKVEEK